MRGAFLAIIVIVLQRILRGRLPAVWSYALWLPVIFVLGAPVLPESALSLESHFLGSPEMISQENAGAAISLNPRTRDMAMNPTPEPSFVDWKRLFSLLWLSGAGLTLTFGLAAYAKATRRIRRCSLAMDPALALADELDEAARVCRLRRIPKVLFSNRIHSPAVTGLLRPILLLPANFASAFDAQERHLILLHELMHLKRADLPVNWLLFVLQSLHWCNPVVWFAFARLRTDRETACDSLVLASSRQDSRSAYGHALLKLETGNGRSSWNLCFVGLFGSGPALRSRVRSIANYRRSHPSWALVGIAFILVLTFAGATRAQNETPADAELGQQIIIEAKFIEVPAGQKLEISTDSVFRDTEKGSTLFLQNPTDAAALSETLTKMQSADTLSTPSVVTMSGRMATIEMRQELTDRAGKTGKVGILLEVLPRLIGDKIELTVEATSTKAVNAETREVVSEISDGASLDFTETRLGTTVTITQDQTIVVISGEPNTDAEPTRRLILTLSARVADNEKAIRKKLAAIMLPRVELKDVSTTEALNFLQAKSRELDPEKRGVRVSFTRASHIESDPTLSLSLTDARLSEALHLVARLSHLVIEYDSRGVILKPRPSPATPPLGKMRTLRQRMEAVILPAMELNEASVADVLDFLEDQSRKLEPGKEDIDFILLPESAEEKTISLQLKSVPISEALRYVADLAELELGYFENTIILSAK